MTKKSKAVLITYHYPPSPEVGGLRAIKVVRAIQAAGFDVTVITARLPTDTGNVRETRDGTRVVVVAETRGIGDVYTWMKSRFFHRKETIEPDGTTLSLEAVSDQRIVPWCKRHILSAMWLPDRRQGFIGPATRAAKRELSSEDMLYTTAPPFSTHLAGLVIKATRRVRWFAEFRDPWADNPWKPAHVRSKWADWAGTWLERLTIHKADRVITVTDAVRRTLAAKLSGEGASKVVLIRNGIDEFYQPTNPTRRPVRVIHLGSIYHKRNPLIFLKALAAVKRRHNIGSSDIVLHFVGNARWFHGVSVEEQAKDLGIDGLVEFTDWVPHQETRRLMQEAGGLLLLAQQQPLQVPNKLYEYLGYQVPIIAIADEEGETAEMLREAGGHFVVGAADQEGLEKAIEAVLGLNGEDSRLEPRREVLHEWSTVIQMQRLAALLKENHLNDSRIFARAP
jgi:glycosyltransferase involved in cell wall biosynthesis